MESEPYQAEKGSR